MPDITQISSSEISQAPEGLANTQHLQAPQNSETTEISGTSQMSVVTKTSATIFPAWPTRQSLMYEMGLTTDEAHKAVYLTAIFDILKRRKSFKHSNDTARAIAFDWYMLSSLFFYNNFKTSKDIYLAASTKTSWRNCFNDEEVMAHPDGVYDNCYFFAPHGKWIYLYQGKPIFGPQAIIKYDMSDRNHRRAYLNVVCQALSSFPPTSGSNPEKKNAKSGGMLDKPLKRIDLSAAVGVREGSSRRRVRRYLAKKGQNARKSRLSAQILMA